MELKKTNNIITIKINKKEIDTIDFASCAEPKQTLEAYYNMAAVKPKVLLNGGLFTLSTGTSVMDFIDEGIIKSSESWIQYGFGIDHTGNMIYAKDCDKPWKDFLSAYPPLMVNGQRQEIIMAQEIAAKNRRSILGYDNNYIYIIVIDYPGATLTEAATIVSNTGCLYAINLDGGASTRLIYDGQTYAAAAYNRPVDNVVAIYTKEVQNSIIYRVQLGAFGTEQNAINFCNKIKLLNGVYKNAYVRFVSPYYKVQVGAFTNKSYANLMVQDLKEKGYNAFIAV